MARAELGSRARVRSAAGKLRAKFPTVLAQQWYQANRRFLEALTKSDVRFQVVSYERLCFQTEAVLLEVAEFLGIEAVGTLSPADSGSHVVTGNKIRLDPEGRSSLQYDTRWMRRFDAQIPYLIMPRVRQLNNQLVWDGSDTGLPGADRL